MVATLFPVEPIVLQHCNAVLRLKWSLRIVPWNITLKRCEMIFKEALVTIGFHEKKHIFCKKITCNQPAKTQSTKSQCLLFIMSGQWRTAISRILASDRFKDKMPIETVSSNGLFMSTRLSWVLFHSTSSSSRPVRVSWHSSNASSVPLLCINHFRREPLMMANKRAKPDKSKDTISGLLTA